MKPNTPQVISFINQKGGCGKTTSAVNALGFFQQQHRKILLIDCDRQRSAARSAKNMELEYREIFETSELLAIMPDVKNEYDLIIIDGPANDSEINRAIIGESNLVLIPTRASVYDIESSENTVQFLRACQRTNRVPPVGAIFLNGVVNNTVSLSQAQAYLNEQAEGLTLLKETIPGRQCISDMGVSNTSVYEMKNRAAKEVAAKYTRLYTQAIAIYEAQK
jgi:chromosome partitioning protein